MKHASPSSSQIPESALLSTIRPGHISIPVDRRKANCYLHHGMIVTIIGEDPADSSRYMVLVPGVEKPKSLAKEIVKEGV